MISRKEKKVYGEAIKEFRPTIRTLLFQILEQKLFNLKRTKQSIYNEGSVFIPEPDRLQNMPLKYIALVSDGVVAEMIRVNEEASKVMLAKKTKMVEFDPRLTMVKKGMTYKNSTFIESEADDKED